MTNTNHTPGPWRVSGYRLAVLAELNGIKVVIADCNRTLGYSESEANARLLAAAPDLLEALQLILTADQRGFDLDYIKGCARAAISKATRSKQ